MIKWTSLVAATAMLFVASAVVAQSASVLISDRWTSSPLPARCLWTALKYPGIWLPNAPGTSR